MFPDHQQCKAEQHWEQVDLPHDGRSYWSAGSGGHPRHGTDAKDKQQADPEQPEVAMPEREERGMREPQIVIVPNGAATSRRAP